MFIAALFTTASLIDKWRKKMWYIHTVEYYLATKTMKSTCKTWMGWM